ncbi:tartrate-resistant acid phosphatase type 5 [Patella vulgata]|uniref:tartrate-resistant acid phosphatase type 5 n=1 Tax=Patella vulgata TaxID=6465 RepID=UPI0024A9BE26|nr:tartrate-resistant acid phosphatase type 5 [Patella vulgata]
MAYIRALLALCCLTVPTLAAGLLNFFAIGDMGGAPKFPYTTPIQVATAREMGILANQLEPEFILALGDNFYTMGVKNVDDPRLKETFENIYKNPALQVPWYLLAGNHDHYGNVSAEIAYTNRSKRWNFPELYYTQSFTIPATSNTVDIIMIDTVTLCGNTIYEKPHLQPQGPDDILKAEAQWQWIEDSLNKSKATYLLVAGHFPVYSVAEHGPTDCLVDRLLPMLYKFNVTAYLCGHDHNLQHLQTTSSAKTTMNFIVTGSANIVDTSMAHKTSVPEDSLKFHWANPLGLGGLAHIQATSQNLTYSFVDALLGSEIYTGVIQPRQVN